jgi:hypothetical protein
MVNQQNVSAHKVQLDLTSGGRYRHQSLLNLANLVATFAEESSVVTLKRIQYQMTMTVSGDMDPGELATGLMLIVYDNSGGFSLTTSESTATETSWRAYFVSKCAGEYFVKFLSTARITFSSYAHISSTPKNHFVKVVRGTYNLPKKLQDSKYGLRTKGGEQEYSCIIVPFVYAPNLSAAATINCNILLTMTYNETPSLAIQRPF